MTDEVVLRKPLLSDEVILRKLKFLVQRQYPAEYLGGVPRMGTVDPNQVVIQDLNLDGWFDDSLDAMYFALSGYVLAEKLAEQKQTVCFSESVTFTSPATWFQHLKQSWNGWIVCRRISRVRWVNRLLIRQVRCTRTIKYVRAERTVMTEQFAGFPASPIKTPEKFRGPIVARYENTTIS